MSETTGEPTWNRSDGQPDPQHLDDVVTRILKVFEPLEPVEIILFGSGAGGELAPTSDADLLVILDEKDRGSIDARRRAMKVMDGREPRVEVLAAYQADVEAAERSLTSVLRTAREEGVTVYRRGRRVPYVPRRRPAVAERVEDPDIARSEAERLRRQATENLAAADYWGKKLEEPGPTATTIAAGYARKAIERALEACIVERGWRPRSWKDPAGLAAEARAAGATLPAVDADALERAANHYSGTAYPGYPEPSAEEATEALELAHRIVPPAR